MCQDLILHMLLNLILPWYSNHIFTDFDYVLCVPCLVYKANSAIFMKIEMYKDEPLSNFIYLVMAPDSV